MVSQGWVVPSSAPRAGRAALLDALQRLDTPFAVVAGPQGPAVAHGRVAIGDPTAPVGAFPLLAWVPALTPDRLGDPGFRAAYGVRVNYVAGEMANGIGAAEIVIAMAKAGMIGFFGAAGLSTERIAAAIDRIQSEVAGLPYGFNLIHSPAEPHQEQATVDLYLARGVRTVCAAAFLKLTPMVVQYRAAGLSAGPTGVRTGNRLIAKVSREEVAGPFLRPAPEAILRELVERGKITAEQAKLAAHVPMADDLTAEADSGGHTDNRPSLVLMPLMIGLRDRIQREHRYAVPVRIGAAGGLGAPLSVAGAFACGAAYVVTGTINQACVEAGTSPMVKKMLADASSTDIDMAPASDMFEAGVQVQVLKRGTMFSRRGHALYTAWREYPSWDAIPQDERKKIETTILRRPFADVWRDCVAFFGDRDPKQLDRARSDPKHQMALVFRWYLGLSSRWAIGGDEDRKADTQVWCGPAIGAFNEWTRGTFLADPSERRVVTVAANLMAGAAAIVRAQSLLSQGVDAGPEALSWVPRRVEE
jgi:trans-AT polyketide synthase/acyltransferase/oxidoreductase domain-containing protein